MLESALSSPPSPHSALDLDTVLMSEVPPPPPRTNSNAKVTSSVRKNGPTKGTSKQPAACMSSQPAILFRLGFGGILAFHLIQVLGEKKLNSVDFCKFKPKVKVVLYSRFLD